MFGRSFILHLHSNISQLSPHLFKSVKYLVIHCLAGAVIIVCKNRYPASVFSIPEEFFQLVVWKELFLSQSEGPGRDDLQIAV